MAGKMATTILKSFTLEKWRQLSNKISIDLGASEELNALIGDHSYDYVANEGQALFLDADVNGLRPTAPSKFAFIPELAIDNTAGYIILKNVTSVPSSFENEARIFQGDSANPSYEATIVTVSNKKILVKNSTGEFSANANLNTSIDVINSANVSSIEIEGYPVVVANVYKNGQLVEQGLGADEFHVPLYSAYVQLNSTPAQSVLDAFVEGQIVYQGTNLANAVWSGKILAIANDRLKLKSQSGNFSASVQIKLDGSAETILGADHGDLFPDFYGIEFNAPLAQGDEVKVQAVDLVNAVNELQLDIGEVETLTTAASDLTSAVNEHDAELGDISAADMNTTATTVSGAIREHSEYINIDGLDTIANTLSGAVNELHNEVNKKINASDTAVQTLNTDLLLTSGNEVVFPSGSTLDIRGGSLLIGGGAGSELSFDTAFLALTAQTNLRGLSIVRDNEPNGELRWNETNPGPRAWQFIGLNEAKNAQLISDAVTFYNAKDLLSNSNQQGINVTWNASNESFDFNVNDPVITLSGDVSGSATMTNLSNTTISVNVNGVQPNSVALGTDTTGNYVATASGTANQVTVSGSGTQTAGITVGLAQDVTIPRDLTTTRNAKVDGTLTVDGNVTLGNSTSDTVTIAGDLIVQGDQTILNTATLEVEDTLILAGNQLTAEPTTGGFGIEVGPITNPSGVAGNVTGAHSIVYNYATNRWEADGSLILSEATLGNPTISGLTFTPSDDLDFDSGAGISQSTAKSGSTITHTVTNTDRGSSQSIFKNVKGDAATLATASVNDDTLTIAGGTFIDTVVSDKTITINHANTSSQNSVSNTAGTVIQSLTLDSRGHLTDISSTDLDNRYPRHDGTNAEGTWDIDISGNAATATLANTAEAAATVTNGVYTNANNILTGANEFRNSGGILVSNTSARDSVIIRGRAGGTSSRRVILTPASLTSNRTLTLPNASGTVALTDGTGASGTWGINISGNAATATSATSATTATAATTATRLATARTIGGVSFNGTANINLPGVNTAGNQNTTGNAATATKLATARTIGGVSFDGSANINLPGVNTAGNQNTTGRADTAVKAQQVNNTRDEGSLRFWSGTQAQYNQISSKSNFTLYFIVG